MPVRANAVPADVATLDGDEWAIRDGTATTRRSAEAAINRRQALQVAREARHRVEQGGMILANGDCGKEIFNKSFRTLGKKMFPKYEFRALPASHPIFKEQQYDADKWKPRPKVQGLSNGVRELMLLFENPFTRIAGVLLWFLIEAS